MAARISHSSVSARRGAAASVVVALALFAMHSGEAADRIKIAVFDFELVDRSAGDGVIAADAIDLEHLRGATEEARRQLEASGRYSVVDTSGVAAAATAAGGIQHCNQCDGPLARSLGADQSMVGVVTRLNRMEYTLQILVRDAETGAVLTNNFSGLRMGANYAWPRGVKAVMARIVPAQRVD